MIVVTNQKEEVERIVCKHITMKRGLTKMLLQLRIGNQIIRTIAPEHIIEIIESNDPWPNPDRKS